ncbi:MAG: plasmid stabilization protein [Rhizobiaceae bacterium]
MSDLLIRDFPSFAKSRIADAAKQNGTSISTEAKRRLIQTLVEDETGTRRTMSAWDELRAAFFEADAILTDEEHEDFMKAIEEGRRDMGRPAPDFE